MRITDWLRADHKVEERLLEGLRWALELEGPERGHRIERALGTLLASLQAHEDVEESLLFPELRRAGAPLPPGVERFLQHEHERLERLLDRVWDAAENGYRDEHEDAVRELVLDLERHMKLEEEHVFPAAERVLGTARMEELAKEARRRASRRRAAGGTA